MTEKNNTEHPPEINKDYLVQKTQESIATLRAVMEHMPRHQSLRNADFYLSTALLWMQHAMENIEDDEIKMHIRKLNLASGPKQ